MTKKQIIIGVVIVLVLAAIAGALIYMPPAGPEEIKIGAILPLTGEAAKYGEDAKLGIDFAVEEINAAGGINGKKIQVVYEDSQAAPSQGVAAIQKLITVDKVPVIIGAMASSVTLAIAPIAEENKVVLLSPASSAAKITEAGDYIFRNEFSDAYGGKVQAESTWDELGIRDVAILYVNNDYGVGVADTFEETFESLGGNITAIESFEQGATDFRTQLTKIKDSYPDAIVVFGYNEVILILKQAKELGIETQILCNPMFEDPEILEKLGDLAEGVIYVYYGGFDPKSEEEQIKVFVSSFSEKYGREPGYYSALSYDAMKIISLAIEKGAFKSEGIKSALYAIKDYPGLTGTTTFDENGDVIKPVTLKTVRNGEFVEWD
jgi:branched-chain amino acid transport system substrate-binding protein